MKCKKCGKELNENVKFCSNCGEMVIKEEVDTDSIADGGIECTQEEVQRAEGDVEDVSGSVDSENKAPKKMSIVPFVFIILCLLMVCGYHGKEAYAKYKEKKKYEAKVEKALDKLHNFEWSEICVTADDMNTSIYYLDGREPIVIDYYNDAGDAQYLYKVNDEGEYIWYAGSMIQPYPAEVNIIDRDACDKLISSIDEFTSISDGTYYLESDDFDYSIINELHNSLCVFDNLSVEDNIWRLKVSFDDEYVKIFCDSEDKDSAVTIVYSSSMDDFENMKKTMINSFSLSNLEGEYYQQGTENKMTIEADRVYMDNYFNAYATININGEDTDVPYYSVQWTEGGCKIDEEVYEYTPEYLDKLEGEKDFEFIRSICTGEKRIHGNPDGVIEFESVSYDENSGYIVVEAKCKPPETFDTVYNVEYHAFCNEGRSKVYLKNEDNKHCPKKMVLDTAYTKGLYADRFVVYK